MGVPYVPVMGLVGTDLLKKRDDMIVAADPFDGNSKTVVARAMRPDVAVFHADRADRRGNVSFGYHVEATILAEASHHVVVTAEEIVDRLEEKEAAGTFLPSILVDTVVHAPFGSHPAGMTGRYAADRAHMQQYVEASRDDDAFAAYLKTYVFDVGSHAEYVERIVPYALKKATQPR